MTVAAVETAMPEDFQGEVRERLKKMGTRLDSVGKAQTKQKIALMAWAITFLLGLVVHAFWFGGEWISVTKDVNANAKAVESNAAALKIVADEQLRRTRNIDAVNDIKVELTHLREMMQQVRDDVIILKAKQDESTPD